MLRNGGQNVGSGENRSIIIEVGKQPMSGPLSEADFRQRYPGVPGERMEEVVANTEPANQMIRGQRKASGL
jgi:hypothetical protein